MSDTYTPYVFSGSDPNEAASASNFESQASSNDNSFSSGSNYSFYTPNDYYNDPTISSPDMPDYSKSQGLVVPTGSDFVQDNTKSMGTTSMPNIGGSGWGAAGNAVGTAVNIYEGASTSTGSSVLSGAAQGAAVGTQIMPGWGTAIGAVAGAIIGFFGAKNARNKARKQYQAELEKAIAPYKQEQANWLQKQGLTQQAVSNYQNVQPYQYKNALLGGSNQYHTPNFGPQAPVNFGAGPPDVATGNMNTPTPNQSANPNWWQQTPGLAAPTTPKWSGKQATDQANANQYVSDYQNYLNNQDLAMQQNALGQYSVVQPYGSNGLLGG